MLRKAKQRLVTSLPHPVRQWLYDRKDLWTWKRGGKEGPPPPIVKRQVVRAYGRSSGARTMVETGTFTGEMVDYNRNNFDRIFTIELDPDLHSKAQARFRSHSSVTTLQGDSSRVLPEVLENLDEPCVFWLDAHYSGGITARGEEDTPLRTELISILRHPVNEHVILIDDARHLTGEAGYPTLDEIQRLIGRERPGWTVELIHDIVRAHPAHITIR